MDREHISGKEVVAALEATVREKYLGWTVRAIARKDSEFYASLVENSVVYDFVRRSLIVWSYRDGGTEDKTKRFSRMSNSQLKAIARSEHFGKRVIELQNSSDLPFYRSLVRKDLLGELVEEGVIRRGNSGGFRLFHVSRKNGVKTGFDFGNQFRLRLRREISRYASRARVNPANMKIFDRWFASAICYDQAEEFCDELDAELTTNHSTQSILRDSVSFERQLPSDRLRWAKEAGLFAQMD